VTQMTLELKSRSQSGRVAETYEFFGPARVSAAADHIGARARVRYFERLSCSPGHYQDSVGGIENRRCEAVDYWRSVTAVRLHNYGGHVSILAVDQIAVAPSPKGWLTSRVAAIVSAETNRRFLETDSVT
jgi:hypothetical protein